MLSRLFSARKPTLALALSSAESAETPLTATLEQVKSSVIQVLSPGSSQSSLGAWLVPFEADASTEVRGQRNRQLDEVLTEHEKKRRRAVAQSADQRIGLAIASFSCATFGFFFWPLRLLSLSGSVYLTAHIYRKAYELLRQGRVGIPTLMVVSLTGALGFGYIWVASFMLIVAQLARKLSDMVTDDSRESLVNVFRQAPRTAWVRGDEGEIETPLEQVQPGWIVIVSAGEVVPVDGLAIGGMATLDQHLLTGESRPVEKGSGEPVFAGTVVLSGRLEIRVEQAGEQTAIARIGQILNATTEYKSTAQLRAERLAQRTVAPTLIAGALALPWLGPMGALAVVDSHFRQRMSILAPLALMNYLNLAAHHGILIKDGRSLDFLSEVDTLVFDKTGTLTEEQPHVAAIHHAPDWDQEQVLRYAAAAEQKQIHPIAHAILAEARRLSLEIPPLTQADYQLGYGLTVEVEERRVQVGSRRFIEAMAMTIPDWLEQAAVRGHEVGHSQVLVACDGVVVGAVELAPTTRPEAREVIELLRRRFGIRHTCIISGDHEVPTRHLAEQLGIDRYFAETLPEQKAELIERLIGEGRFVCYIGDGINDAIALKKSQVSISLRGASSVATDTAQIILMEGDLKRLPHLFEFSTSFHDNTNRAFAISVVPSAISIGGALFLHFGLAQTCLLALGSIFVGLGNAMLPLWQHRLETGETSLSQTESR